MTFGALHLTVAGALVDIAGLVIVLAITTALKALILVRAMRVDIRRPPLTDPRVFAVEYLSVVAILPPLTWMVARHGESWRGLGLSSPLEGPVAFFTQVGTLLAASLLLNLAWRRLFAWVTGREARSPYEAIYGRWRPWAVMVAYALLFAGLVEELAFRGFLLSRLAILFGGTPEAAVVAVIVVAALFGVMHVQAGASSAVNAAALGGLFGAAYVVTGNLTLVVVVHSLYDAVKVTGYFLRPGHSLAATAD